MQNSQLFTLESSGNAERPIHEIRQEQIHGLKRWAGFHWIDIARMLGMSPRTLSRQSQEFGVPLSQQHNFLPGPTPGQYWGNPWCNIIYLFSLFCGLLSGLGSLLRMFCCLCFTSAVSYKLCYTGDEPNIVRSILSVTPL